MAIEDTGGVNRNSHAALSSIINEHHLHHSAPSILSGWGWLMSGKMEPKLIIKQGKLLEITQRQELCESVIITLRNDESGGENENLIPQKIN